MNIKKAISPLIASVLLIVVVVGIGAVVTGIVRNYVTENKQTITEKSSDLKCGTEVMIDIPTVADQYKLCKKNNATAAYIVFTLQNKGSMTIDDLQMKVFGTGGFTSRDTIITDLGDNDGLRVGETYEFHVSYTNTSLGTFQEVKIVPRIKVAGRTEKAFCSDSGLNFGDLSACT